MDVWIYLPGIRHNSGSLDAWPDQFTHLTHFTTHARAYPAEHYFWVIRNYAKLRQISAQLVAVIIQYKQRGYRIHLCTHSNGAVVACRLLGLLPQGTRIESLHAIAPAAWGDCQRNGLNHALADNRLGHFYFYGSTADLVVRFGRYTGWLLRPIGAGYGGMAFTGPRNISPQVSNQVHPFWASQLNPRWLAQWPGTHQSDPRLKFGHSNWFHDEHYRQTFARVHHNTATHCKPYAAHLQQVCRDQSICFPKVGPWSTKRPFSP